MLNMAIAMGNLAKPAQVRALPSGLMFAYFDLQVRTADQVLETVPVAIFDAPAQVPEWTTGQGLLAVGRVRRRFFRSGGATQSRTAGGGGPHRLGLRRGRHRHRGRGRPVTPGPRLGPGPGRRRPLGAATMKSGGGL